MDDAHLVVLEHAYKHGLTEDEIRYAWKNSFVKFTRTDDVRGEVIAAFGPAGEREVIISIDDCVGVLGRAEGMYVYIFHASLPPVPTLRIELEKWRKVMGSH